jgi:hypothetical protein
MMKKLLATMLLSSLSCVVNAASPFVVSHSTVTNGGDQATVKTTQTKRITLAQSLVQLRQCDATDHQSGEAQNSETTDQASLAKQNSPL